MAQIIRLNNTFVNLDNVCSVAYNEDGSVAVLWTSGNQNVYTGEQANTLIAALDYLKALSLSFPN